MPIAPLDHQLVINASVATITLNRPHAYNALTGAMLDSLLETVRALERDAAVRAVVITGAGKGFCSGQALDDEASLSPGKVWSIGTTVLTHYNPLVLAMLQSRKPYIAAVNGVVTGAGLGLALACDIRIAAGDAIFSTGFAKIGLAADAGVTLLLPRVIGYGRALELTLLGDRCDAPAAQRIGLVTSVVPVDSLATAAAALAQRLAAGPASLGIIKSEFVRNGLGDVVAALEREAAAQNAAGRTDDARAGIAAFREKRTAAFTGR